MHGLVNRSIQQFVTHTYGEAIWVKVTRVAGIPFIDFEGMLTYRETYTPQLLDASAAVLGRPRSEVMEDIGTFIVSHPGFEAVRRLLRFGGDDFVDFLHSLDDLHDRTRLAVSGLRLPKVELFTHTDGQFELRCEAELRGYGNVMMGVLRAMADDYGALVFLEHGGWKNGGETVAIALVENDFAEGRSFELGAHAG